MKVQCDVCEKAQATILSCADEASLCAECDTRVHAANKLASKHQRVALMYPSPEDLPCCDICQEKPGYFFCLEDRALLCRSCDYSIHSTNALAAKHKRFLVSGVRVGLRAITASDASESIQACTPSQVGSPTAQVSQLSSPATQVSHLSSPKNTHQQKSGRLTPLLSKNGCLVPEESSSMIMNIIREEALNKVPSLPSARQEQQQSSSSLIINIMGEEALNNAPSLPSAKKEQQQAKHLIVTSSQQKIQQNSTTGVFPSKVVGPSSVSLPSSSINQQMYLNGGRQLSNWGMGNDMNNNTHDFSKLDVATQRGSGGGSVRRSSISEYLTESIPGWRVDEILNLPDIDAIYNYADFGTSKTDAATSDVEWPAECSGSDSEGLGEAVAAMVPKMPSPPTASGVPRLTKPWGFGKPLKEPDLDFVLHCDDPLVVPDIGGVSSPTTLSPSSLHRKRRRTFFEF
ncbi:hypothetical protein GOP47_0009384 [Adiantum capillus-veneris]|uniref:B box-type domain-containing protein n=1 Tax=Adiantum capillus-veneris TaxID=13818 RepID=A0A9D4ZH51_ADICA|nr:hypothetical protein GOP47_0009384 [Adiantum capillus-veneris]